MPCPEPRERQLRRRQFITLLGSAAATWPFAARAQQGERVRRGGVLLPATPDDFEYPMLVNAFVQGLQQLGWTDGRNIRIESAGLEAVPIPTVDMQMS